MSGPASAPSAELPRPFPSTNSSYDSNSAPPTLSPQSPGGQLPGMALLGPQLMNRPDSSGRLPFPPPMHMPQIPDGQNRYAPEYDPMLAQDRFGMSRMMAPAPGMPGDPIQGHKRAYRQRRKDPSCDACRERKVKCDATDTSSCSECSSRSVKCQFTKETNRRMSSIKHVQDLEKQLLAARQEVSKLQSMVKPDGGAIEDEDDVAATQARPKKRRRVAYESELLRVQRNMSNYARGIFRPPTSTKQPRSNFRSPPISSPELPPKTLGEQLIGDYKAFMHQKFPFVDWKLLSHQFDQAYRDQTSQVVEGESAAVLFGVFACGSLRNHFKEGQKLFAALKLLVNFWTATPTMELIRAMVLSCLFMIETNNTSAAFSMMGQAVRAAQDIGLHRRGGGVLSEEEQLKKNLWLTLFSIERTLAYELGRPSMISDDENDPLAEPNADTNGAPPASRLEIIVHVASLATHLRRAFKNPMISNSVASALDVDLNRCMSRLPPRMQLGSSEPIAPNETHAVVYLQDIRLLLHRHNLSPTCPADVRVSGLSECLKTAVNTARYLSRMLDNYARPPTGDDMAGGSSQQRSLTPYEDDVRICSSTFTCLHMWRCMLFLTAYEDYAKALICATVCRAIGNARPINEACGRYFEFFLGFCVETKQREGAARVEEDEEMIAYLSADLQGNIEQAWIWQDESEGKSAPYENGVTEPLVDGEAEQEWDRWAVVVERLERLVEQQQQQQQQQKRDERGPELQPQPSSLRTSSINGPYLAPKIDTAMSPVQQLSPSNRMSIADLI